MDLFDKIYIFIESGHKQNILTLSVYFNIFKNYKLYISLNILKSDYTKNFFKKLKRNYIKFMFIIIE